MKIMVLVAGLFFNSMVVAKTTQNVDVNKVAENPIEVLALLTPEKDKTLPCSKYYVYSHEFGTIINETQASHDLILELSEVLGTFINGTNFDHVGFEAQEEDLKKKLSFITERVREIFPCSDLSLELGILKKKFEVMTYVIEDLARFKALGIPVFVWIPKHEDLPTD